MMRGVRVKCRRSPSPLVLVLFLFLFAIWKRPVVRSAVETRGGWFHLGHIYYPNLDTVRTFVAYIRRKLPDRPRFSSHADRASAIGRIFVCASSTVSPLFSPPPPPRSFRLPRRIRYRGVGGLITIITTLTRRSIGAWWHVTRSGYFHEGNAMMSKNCIPRTSSLLNLRSRRARETVLVRNKISQEAKRNFRAL